MESDQRIHISAEEEDLGLCITSTSTSGGPTAATSSASPGTIAKPPTPTNAAPVTATLPSSAASPLARVREREEALPLPQSHSPSVRASPSPLPNPPSASAHDSSEPRRDGEIDTAAGGGGSATAPSRSPSPSPPPPQAGGASPHPNPSVAAPSSSFTVVNTSRNVTAVTGATATSDVDGDGDVLSATAEGSFFTVASTLTPAGSTIITCGDATNALLSSSTCSSRAYAEATKHRRRGIGIGGGGDQHRRATPSPLSRFSKEVKGVGSTYSSVGGDAISSAGAGVASQRHDTAIVTSERKKEMEEGGRGTEGEANTKSDRAVTSPTGDDDDYSSGVYTGTSGRRFHSLCDFDDDVDEIDKGEGEARGATYSDAADSESNSYGGGRRSTGSVSGDGGGGRAKPSSPRAIRAKASAAASRRAAALSTATATELSATEPSAVADPSSATCNVSPPSSPFSSSSSRFDDDFYSDNDDLSPLTSLRKHSSAVAAAEKKEKERDDPLRHKRRGMTAEGKGGNDGKIGGGTAVSVRLRPPPESTVGPSSSSQQTETTGPNHAQQQPQQQQQQSLIISMRGGSVVKRKRTAATLRVAPRLAPPLPADANPFGGADLPKYDSEAPAAVYPTRSGGNGNAPTTPPPPSSSSHLPPEEKGDDTTAAAEDGGDKSAAAAVPTPSKKRSPIVAKRKKGKGGGGVFGGGGYVALGGGDDGADDDSSEEEGEADGVAPSASAEVSAAAPSPAVGGGAIGARFLGSFIPSFLQGATNTVAAKAASEEAVAALPPLSEGDKLRAAAEAAASVAVAKAAAAGDDDLDAAGRAQLRIRNVFFTRLAFVLLYGAFAACFPFYGAYLHTRGFGPIVIGLIVVWNPLGTVFVLPLLSALLSRLEARRVRREGKRERRRRLRQSRRRRGGGGAEAAVGQSSSSFSLNSTMEEGVGGNKNKGWRRRLSTWFGGHREEPSSASLQRRDDPPSTVIYTRREASAAAAAAAVVANGGSPPTRHTHSRHQSAHQSGVYRRSNTRYGIVDDDDDGDNGYEMVSVSEESDRAALRLWQQRRFAAATTSGGGRDYVDDIIVSDLYGTASAAAAVVGGRHRHHHTDSSSCSSSDSGECSEEELKGDDDDGSTLSPDSHLYSSSSAASSSSSSLCVPAATVAVAAPSGDEGTAAALSPLGVASPGPQDTVVGSTTAGEPAPSLRAEPRCGRESSGAQAARGGAFASASPSPRSTEPNNSTIRRRRLASEEAKASSIGATVTAEAPPSSAAHDPSGAEGRLHAAQLRILIGCAVFGSFSLWLGAVMSSDIYDPNSRALEGGGGDDEPSSANGGGGRGILYARSYTYPPEGEEASAYSFSSASAPRILAPMERQQKRRGETVKSHRDFYIPSDSLRIREGEQGKTNDIAPPTPPPPPARRALRGDSAKLSDSLQMAFGSDRMLGPAAAAALENADVSSTNVETSSRGEGGSETGGDTFTMDEGTAEGEGWLPTDSEGDTIYTLNAPSILILVAVTVALQSMLSVPIPPFVDYITMRLIAAEPSSAAAPAAGTAGGGGRKGLGRKRAVAASRRVVGGGGGPLVCSAAADVGGGGAQQRALTPAAADIWPRHNGNLPSASHPTSTRSFVAATAEPDANANTAPAHSGSFPADNEGTVAAERATECPHCHCATTVGATPSPSGHDSSPAAGGDEEGNNTNSNCNRNFLSASAARGGRASAPPTSFLEDPTVAQWNSIRAVGALSWALCAPAFAALSDGYGYGFSFVGYGLGVLGACVLLLEARAPPALSRGLPATSAAAVVQKRQRSSFSAEDGQRQQEEGEGGNFASREMTVIVTREEATMRKAAAAAGTMDGEGHTPSVVPALSPPSDKKRFAASDQQQQQQQQPKALSRPPPREESNEMEDEAEEVYEANERGVSVETNPNTDSVVRRRREAALLGRGDDRESDEGEAEEAAIAAAVAAIAAQQHDRGPQQHGDSSHQQKPSRQKRIKSSDTREMKEQRRKKKTSASEVAVVPAVAAASHEQQRQQLQPPRRPAMRFISPSMPRDDEDYRSADEEEREERRAAGGGVRGRGVIGNTSESPSLGRDSNIAGSSSSDQQQQQRPAGSSEKAGPATSNGLGKPRGANNREGWVFATEGDANDPITDRSLGDASPSSSGGGSGSGYSNAAVASALLRFILHPHQRRLLAFLFATAVMGMGLSFLSTYLFIFLRADRDCSQVLLGCCVTAAAAAEIVTFRIASWLHKSFSDRQLLAYAMLLWSVRAGVVTLVGNGPQSWWVLAAEPLHGASYALCWLAGANTLASALAAPAFASSGALRLASAASTPAVIIGTLHTSVFGIGNAIGMVVGGVGIQMFSFSGFFRLASVLMSAAAGVFIVSDRYWEREIGFRRTAIDAASTLICEAVALRHQRRGILATSSFGRGRAEIEEEEEAERKMEEEALLLLATTTASANCSATAAADNASSYEEDVGELRILGAMRRERLAAEAEAAVYQSLVREALRAEAEAVNRVMGIASAALLDTAAATTAVHRATDAAAAGADAYINTASTRVHNADRNAGSYHHSRTESNPLAHLFTSSSTSAAARGGGGGGRRQSADASEMIMDAPPASFTSFTQEGGVGIHIGGVGVGVGGAVERREEELAPYNPYGPEGLAPLPNAAERVLSRLAKIAKGGGAVRRWWRGERKSGGGGEGGGGGGGGGNREGGGSGNGTPSDANFTVIVSDRGMAATASSGNIGANNVMTAGSRQSHNPRSSSSHNGRSPPPAALALPALLGGGAAGASAIVHSRTSSSGARGFALGPPPLALSSPARSTPPASFTSFVEVPSASARANNSTTPPPNTHNNNSNNNNNLSGGSAVASPTIQSGLGPPQLSFEASLIAHHQRLVARGAAEDSAVSVDVVDDASGTTVSAFASTEAQRRATATDATSGRNGQKKKKHSATTTFLGGMAFPFSIRARSPARGSGGRSHSRPPHHSPYSDSSTTSLGGVGGMGGGGGGGGGGGTLPRLEPTLRFLSTDILMVGGGLCGGGHIGHPREATDAWGAVHGDDEDDDDASEEDGDGGAFAWNSNATSGGDGSTSSAPPLFFVDDNDNNDVSNAGDAVCGTSCACQRRQGADSFAASAEMVVDVQQSQDRSEIVAATVGANGRSSSAKLSFDGAAATEGISSAAAFAVTSSSLSPHRSRITLMAEGEGPIFPAAIGSGNEGGGGEGVSASSFSIGTKSPLSTRVSNQRWPSVNNKNSKSVVSPPSPPLYAAASTGLSPAPSAAPSPARGSAVSRTNSFTRPQSQQQQPPSQQQRHRLVPPGASISTSRITLMTDEEMQR